jgi:hypothetical protein
MGEETNTAQSGNVGANGNTGFRLKTVSDP